MFNDKLIYREGVISNNKRLGSPIYVGTTKVNMMNLLLDGFRATNATNLNQIEETNHFPNRLKLASVFGIIPIFF